MIKNKLNTKGTGTIHNPLAGEIVLYASKDGSSQLEVKLDCETVWLNQRQLSDLFGKDVRTVNEHIGNIYKEKELTKSSTIRKFRIVQIEGKRSIERNVEFYNLDAIISVGYRVKSKQGTQFRIWATKILREHVVKGFTLNERRLRDKTEKDIRELKRAISLLRNTVYSRQLSGGEAEGLLYVITEYANTWTLLQQYDNQTIPAKLKQQKYTHSIDYISAKNEIEALKFDLMRKEQASDFFGREREQALAGILGSITQSFGGTPVYETIEQQAAHLLYFVIKDHPFTDGNKRIASFLFVMFLNKNKYLMNKNGERKINDNALVALALLIAESRPNEKDIMIALITNLL